ncbi:hypothetical protein LB507_011183, partial [Fusarium sp. FIESC RH6]
TSLLDTYTKCLSLLKGSRKYDAGPLSDTQSTLSASLRSDRSRVRKAYVSRLSKDGSRFEKGDVAWIMNLKRTLAPARSALRRIVKRLTTALSNVVCSSRDGKGQPLNYESLLVLSNGSSLDAIRTINDLSSRVASRSQSSVVSRGRQRSHRHDHKAGNKSEKRSERKKHTSRRGHPSVDRHRQRSSRSRHSTDKPAPHDRVSIVTIQSDSTKLGEIRRRLSKQRPTETYENMAAYPHYYSYQNEGIQARKKWWNPFKR